jgi:oxygen-dependent protoporphyrinogen oxidase
VTSPDRPTIAVVGGGIAGLAAAWELLGGANDDRRRAPIVQVLESGPRMGGMLDGGAFAGRNVDLAADAFVARRPEATDLCRQLGLTDDLVPLGASGAAIWARGQLRPMPAALQLGVPTRWWPLARSGMLSPAESLRVARDLVAPRRGSGPADDRSVGAIVGERLGRPVVERLVDPLVGGINAGGVDELSAAASFPALLAASQQPGSLMRRMRPARPTPQQVPRAPSPMFWSLANSTASLADELALALARRGATLRTNTPVVGIQPRPTGPPGSGRWQLVLDGPAGPGGGPTLLEADGVILAVPAGTAARLLAPHAPVAAAVLDEIDYASVAVVTLSIPAGAIRAPMQGTGFLVPRTSTIGGRPALITGCTYLGRKWPHLARSGDELLRASVGRYGDERHRSLGDDELTATVLGELSHLLGVGEGPLESLVTRWEGAFPQYRVGHLARVERIERALDALDGVALAGAAYRGVGIPACIGSGRAAARRVVAAIAPEGTLAAARAASPETGP